MDQAFGDRNAVGADDISREAEDMARALNRLMKQAHQPDARKRLRKFSSAEAADLLGVSQSNLRMRHQDPDFPEVESDGRGRIYSAEEIHKIRRIFAETGKNKAKFMPGRRAGDKLQVISIVNFKGGSSKTTTTIHLAQRLALKGHRVLAIDMDPQGSLTTFFGYRPELDFPENGTIYDALRYDDPVPLQDVIRKTYFPQLDVIPAGLMLAEYETETANALTARISPIFALRLNNALMEVQDDYDVVLIDCPPQLGFLTLTALAASTGLLVTVVAGMLDVASMSQFLKLAAATVSAIEDAIDTKVRWDFHRYLLTRFEPNDAPQAEIAGFLRTIMLGRVMTQPMLKSSAISDAGLTQQTIYEVDQKQLTKKTIERALTSVNSVTDELEALLHKAWGR